MSGSTNHLREIPCTPDNVWSLEFWDKLLNTWRMSTEMTGSQRVSEIVEAQSVCTTLDKCLAMWKYKKGTGHAEGLTYRIHNTETGDFISCELLKEAV